MHFVAARVFIPLAMACTQHDTENHSGGSVNISNEILIAATDHRGYQNEKATLSDLAIGFQRVCRHTTGLTGSRAPIVRQRPIRRH